MLRRYAGFALLLVLIGLLWLGSWQLPINTLAARPLIVTNTPRAADTLPPTHTPPPSQPLEPTLVINGTYTPPAKPPVTAIPLRLDAPQISDDVVTVLLLGSDSSAQDVILRTDVIVVVVINRTANSVSMLHFPRDLLVYAPNDTMRKLNTVAARGSQMYGQGGAARLMKETLAYNFGLKIDFYARIGFNEFKKIIEALGGLKITVDCGIQGNRLKSPELDPLNPESYEVYTLTMGKYTLDPYMALWYVRSRGSTNDMDRGRRQIEVLQAIWRQSRDAGLITQLTVLWPELQKIVETDMTLTDMLGLAPIALALDPANIQRIGVYQNVHFRQWYTSDNGSFTWLPDREAWKTAIQNLFTSPRNRLSGESPRVAVFAVAGWKGFAETAGNRLAWEGFSVLYPNGADVRERDWTVVYDFTGGAKPNSLARIRKALRLGEAQIVSQPDPNATTDFQVIIGRDYLGSCLYTLPQ